MVDLDAIAGTGNYFEKAKWNFSGKADLRCVAKAIAALDGQITVVWSEA